MTVDKLYYLRQKVSVNSGEDTKKWPCVVEVNVKYDGCRYFAIHYFFLVSQ